MELSCKLRAELPGGVIIGLSCECQVKLSVIVRALVLWGSVCCTRKWWPPLVELQARPHQHTYIHTSLNFNTVLTCPGASTQQPRYPLLLSIFEPQKITMGLLSLLPESLQTVETWIIRVFVRILYLHSRRQSLHELTLTTTTQFLLAIITFGPWIALLVYDIILYIWRSATFDLPQIGGRARGQRQRPRAPSLKERPDGHKRRFSLAGVLVPPPVDFHQAADGTTVTTPTSSTSGHKRNITATMSRPIFEFVDDDE